MPSKTTRSWDSLGPLPEARKKSRLSSFTVPVSIRICSFGYIAFLLVPWVLCCDLVLIFLIPSTHLALQVSFSFTIAPFSLLEPLHPEFPKLCVSFRLHFIFPCILIFPIDYAWRPSFLFSFFAASSLFEIFPTALFHYFCILNRHIC